MFEVVCKVAFYTYGGYFRCDEAMVVPKKVVTCSRNGSWVCYLKHRFAVIKVSDGKTESLIAVCHSVLNGGSESLERLYYQLVSEGFIRMSDKAFESLTAVSRKVVGRG